MKNESSKQAQNKALRKTDVSGSLLTELKFKIWEQK